MLAFRAERADVAWAVVHQAVADHLVLALEAFAALGARAACDWAVVWSTLAVHIFVGAGGVWLAGVYMLWRRQTELTLADIASETFQLCSLGRRICTVRVS